MMRIVRPAWVLEVMQQFQVLHRISVNGTRHATYFARIATRALAHVCMLAAAAACLSCLYHFIDSVEGGIM